MVVEDQRCLGTRDGGRCRREKGRFSGEERESWGIVCFIELLCDTVDIVVMCQDLN